MRITEDTLEQALIEWLGELGFGYEHGSNFTPDSSDERTSYKQVILEQKLRNALERVNPNLPAKAIDDALYQIINPSHPSLLQRNREFQKLLSTGIKVEYDNGDEEVGDIAYLVDFENVDNNEWLVVNQFTIEGTYANRRPDVIIFVNGLPLFVFELKNPADEEADIWKAYEQIQFYKERIEDLFNSNIACIISDGIDARIGSLTANKERFMAWRAGDEDEASAALELEKFTRAFFIKENLLSYMQYFILFEEDEKNIIKKIAGYHQFYAVQAAMKSTLAATSENGDRRAGVVWHTQGSGKSISMTCYASMVMRHKGMNNPTLVIVTDRNELDNQLFEQFCKAKDALGELPQKADSREEVKELLANRPSGGVIFTTIQKFGLNEDSNEYPALSERKNIVVISDEAHRSQYGHKARVDKETGKVKYGYSKYLRDALPNASFIGFTGTPVEMEDRDTRAVFGGYVHIYDIKQAVEDGATVTLHYEPRYIPLTADEEMLAKLDEELDEILEDEEEESSEKHKSNWSTMARLAGAEPRVKLLAKDIVEHFEERTSALDGKAMAVCMTRDICADLYEEIIKLRPDWHDDDPMKGVVKVIMTSNASDSEKLRRHNYGSKVKKDMEKRAKNPDDPLKIVIVRDMWLTGFDAPSMHTMYIDKPMKGHNLMQAIARVNRVFKDKPSGLIVDYIGIANELKLAKETYTASNGKGDIIIDSQKQLELLKEKMHVVRDMLHGVDYSSYQQNALSVMPLMMDHILGLDDGKKRFADAVLIASKAMAICGTLDEATDYRDELALFQAVKSALSKKAGGKLRSKDDIDNAMRQIISNAVITDDIVDIFDASGVKKPDISILSDDFLKEFSKMPQKNLAVELLERIMADKIKSKADSNITTAKKYSDRLKEVISRYQSRTVDTSEIIEELISMAKEYNQAEKRGDNLGLNSDELSFYDALETNEAAVRELGDEVLVTIARELTDKLRKSVTIDWQNRESVRAKIRIAIKRILKTHKYPPDKQEKAIETVLKQAELLSHSLVQ